MTLNLKNICSYMFRSRYERQDTYIECKPYFYRFIGVDNSDEYDDILKTIQSKFEEEKDKCIIFDGCIPLSGEMELIQYIFNELSNMNVFNMENQDITIFADHNINLNFLKSLDYVIQIAVAKEAFFNDSVRNNFITKLIVWAFSFIKDLVYDDRITPKCAYYGPISRHEIYFLILLNKMGFDVIYINPLKEELWSEIEDKGISQCKKSMGILGLETFEKRCVKGKLIENYETITKQIQRDVESQLFADTGMYKPWQFRKGYTNSILLDTIVEDLLIYWNEPCKLRSGFKVEGTNVRVPCFFFKIDGQYTDEFKFKNLVKHCCSYPNTKVFNTGNVSKDVNVTQDMYELMFCELSDGTFDIDELKKVNLYKFSKYSDDVQNFLLKKFNETITSKDLYVKSFNKEEILRFLLLVLNLDEDIVRMVDNFDYTGSIPKIVIYLNDEEMVNESMQLLLGYLHTIGFDIVIFNPSGLFNINNVIKDKAINSFRLQVMSYNSNFNKLMSMKEGFLSKILKK